MLSPGATRLDTGIVYQSVLLERAAAAADAFCTWRVAASASALTLGRWPVRCPHAGHRLLGCPLFLGRGDMVTAQPSIARGKEPLPPSGTRRAGCIGRTERGAPTHTDPDYLRARKKGAANSHTYFDLKEFQIPRCSSLPVSTLPGRLRISVKKLFASSGNNLRSLVNFFRGGRSPSSVFAVHFDAVGGGLSGFSSCGTLRRKCCCTSLADSATNFLASNMCMMV